MATELEVRLIADIRQLRRQLDVANQKLEQFGQASGEAQRGGDKVTKANRKTSASAVELGRALGDLPFGIQGVANNLQQLAFTLGASGGVTLAVAAVTSALVVFERQGLTLSQTLQLLGGSLTQAERAQAAFNKAVREGVGQAQAEGATLNALLNIARDVTQTTQTRQKAINEINREYGEFLPNINAENVATQRVTEAVNKYNQSLIRQAKIKGAQDLISKEYANILELESQNGINAANALDFLTAALGNVGAAGTLATSLTTKGFARQNKEISEAQQRIETLTSAIQNLLTEDFSLGTRGVTTATAAGKNSAKNFRQAFDLEIAGRNTTIPNLFPFAEIEEQAKDSAEVFVTAFNSTIGGRTITIPNFSAFADSFQETTDAVLNTGQILAAGLTDAFASIGTALAQAGGGIQDIGKALLGVLGNIITRFGAAAIQAGVTALALKNIFANPGAAIAAGGLLVALGTALSSATSSVGAIGTSGVGGQGSGGFTGSTSFSSSGAGFSDGTVVFEIEGQKLVGVLNRTLGRNGRLGGNLSLS